MKLKEKELIAITHLAFYVISADGIATEDEFSAVSTELLTFGLDPDDIVKTINAANDMTLEEAVAICRTMKSPQKTYACSVMGYIVASDGDIDDDDEYRIYTTCGRVGGNTTVTMDNGMIHGSIFGGGRLALAEDLIGIQLVLELSAGPFLVQVSYDGGEG